MRSMVEGSPTQSAVFHRHPSTTRFASGPPPPDKLGEDFYSANQAPTQTSGAFQLIATSLSA
jgi:hypothetical protein